MNFDEFVRKDKKENPGYDYPDILNDWTEYCKAEKKAAVTNKLFYNRVFLVQTNEYNSVSKLFTLIKTGNSSYLDVNYPEPNTNRVEADFITVRVSGMHHSREISYNRDCNVSTNELKNYKEVSMDLWNQCFNLWRQIVKLTDENLYKINEL